MTGEYLSGSVPVNLVILGKTLNELFDLLPAGLVSTTFMEHSAAICRRPEAAGDVMSGLFVRLLGPDNGAEFCDPRLKHSL